MSPKQEKTLSHIVGVSLNSRQLIKTVKSSIAPNSHRKSSTLYSHFTTKRHLITNMKVLTIFYDFCVCGFSHD